MTTLANAADGSHIHAPFVEEGNRESYWKRCVACGERFDVRPLRRPFLVPADNKGQP